jgi:two-component system, OmpR family, response regulator TctD
VQKPDLLVSQHRVDRALTAPPLRSNAESSLVATFSLLFKLTRAESRALVKLVKFDHVSKEELHQAIAHDDNPVTGVDNVKVVIYRLRQELDPHDIKLVTVRGLGYRLDPTARDRIRKILAEYGEDVISAATPPAIRQASEERP